MTPLPCLTRSTTRAFGGFFWSRFGPTVPFAPASASVWQLVQPAVWKLCLPSASAPAAGGVGRRGGAAALGEARLAGGGVAARREAARAAARARERREREPRPGEDAAALHYAGGWLETFSCSTASTRVG